MKASSLFSVLSLFVPIVLATTFVTRGAFADDKAACLESASQAQRLKDTHKLVEAREQLRACAATQCPAVVQSDCANWLAELDKALPTVVVTARSAAGVDLVEVKVSVDGQPLVSTLEGQAVPMNPGSHTFHFEGADGASLEQRFVVKEGEKSQAVAVVLVAAPATAVSSSALAPASDSGGSSSPWKTVGLVLGGTGVAGLGVGTALGLMAMSSWNNSKNECQSAAICPQHAQAVSDHDAAVTEGTISTIGYIAGGLLLAGGATLFVVGGSRRATGATVVVLPHVDAEGAGVALAGRF
jgi:hypothetical protein